MSQCPSCDAEVVFPPDAISITCSSCGETVSRPTGPNRVLIGVVVSVAALILLGGLATVCMGIIVVSSMGGGGAGTTFQTPNVIVPDITNPELDYIHDADAAAGLVKRLDRLLGEPPRIKMFIIDAESRAVITQAGLPNREMDSIVFSWGQTVRTPVELTEDEQRVVNSQLMTLQPSHVRLLPEMVKDAEGRYGDGAKVRNAMLMVVPGPPKWTLSVKNDRRPDKNYIYGLDGRFIETDD